MKWPRALPPIAQGYTRFQLKVGGDPDADIQRIRAARAVLKETDRLVADANTGWTQHEAKRVVRAVRDLDVYIEQPCLTYEECLAVRRSTDHPFVLDENIDSLDMLLRAEVIWRWTSSISRSASWEGLPRPG